MILRNVKTATALKLPAWRKLAIGSWKNVCEASIYASLELEVNEVLQKLIEINKTSSVKVTLTAVLVRAIAETLKHYPQMNCLLRLGKLYPRNSVDIFVHVAVDERGEDLSGFVVRNADHKTIVEIASEIAIQSEKLREDKSNPRKKGFDGFAKSKKVFSCLPGFLARPMLGLSTFILYTLNIWSPLLGVPRDAFGSAMVTNVGALGIRTAFAPIAPYTRVPLVLAAGKTEVRQIRREGQWQEVTVLPLSVTLDHRVIDGLYAGLMGRMLKTTFEQFRNNEGAGGGF